tara:strand:- start:933 stop:1829 length:897 start_codon:yes stop_codon:yes gene_type:complete
MAQFTELKNRNFSIICGDPGGTFVIKNFLNKKKFLPRKMFLSKVSKKILGKKFIKFEEGSSKEFFSSSKIFVLSTSWKSKLELKFLSKNAKKKGIKIISFLDSWFNYKRRFRLKNKYYYPDEIWTFDKYAFDLAKKIFRGKSKIKYEKLSVKKNLQENLNKKKYSKNILYLTEPISELAKKMYGYKKFFNYDEINILDIFLTNCRSLFKNILSITIRIHPNEKKRKYSKILKKHKNLPIQVSKNSLKYDLNHNNKVIGTTSSVLFLALQENKIVYTVLHKKNKFFKIPFKKLRYLNLT